MITTNKKHEMQQAIMWDLRCMRSGFGSQVLTNMRTEPSGAFGTAHRDAGQKVCVEATDSVRWIQLSVQVLSCCACDYVLSAPTPACRGCRCIFHRTMPEQALGITRKEQCTRRTCASLLFAQVQAVNSISAVRWFSARLGPWCMTQRQSMQPRRI